MENEKKDSILESTSDISKNGNKKLLILGAVVIVVLIGLVVGAFQMFKKQSFELVAEPGSLELSMTNSSQVRLYKQNVRTNERQEVTNEAEWSTTNSEIIDVGNDSIKGYIITKKQEVNTEVIARYDGLEIKIPVNISKADLEVECYPVLAAEWTEEGIKTAKVGEEIDWMGFYSKIGSPHYFYEWTGTDDLKSNDAIATKTYETPGLKKVRFFTKDTAGTIAETTCSINIVK